MPKHVLTMTVTVEVNRDAWIAAYGIDPLADFSDDVRSYVRTQLQESPAAHERGFGYVNVGPVTRA